MRGMYLPLKLPEIEALSVAPQVRSEGGTLDDLEIRRICAKLLHKGHVLRSELCQEFKDEVEWRLRIVGVVLFWSRNVGASLGKKTNRARAAGAGRAYRYGLRRRWRERPSILWPIR